jgi:integrase
MNVEAGRPVRRRKRQGGVYKINGKWSIDYFYKGRRVRKATEAATRAEAAKLRAVRLSDIEREHDYHLPVSHSAVLLSTLCDDYMENYAKVNKRSWRRDQTSIKHILRFFGNVAVERISREQCEAFKKERAAALQQKSWREAGQNGGAPTAKNATANRDMAVLKKMFAWSVEMGKLKENVARPVMRLKEQNRPFYVVNAAEEERLLSAAAQARKAAHLKPILALALGTGMRLGEVLNLEWSHVDFITRTITVAKSKSGKSRSIPMEWGGVVDILKSVQSLSGEGRYVFADKNGNPMGSIKTAFMMARAKAGISTKCRFHDLRHTFGSRCAQLGMDVMTIKELMGHAAVTTTMRYMHVGEDHKRRALREAAAKWQKNSDYTVTGVAVAFGENVVTA